MLVQELILFSRADLERSIPSMVDGLKPGQRKILFCCFKRNIRKDVKARPRHPIAGTLVSSGAVLTQPAAHMGASAPSACMMSAPSIQGTTRKPSLNRGTGPFPT